MDTTAVSIVSFSIVLMEMFASLGLSTLIPATFLALARAARRAGAAATAQNIIDSSDSFGGKPTSDGTIPQDPPGKIAMGILQQAATAVDAIDLLVPSSATIDADFEFHGHQMESLKASAGTGPALTQLVTIKAGYAALYETSSSNKLKLHVEFRVVNYALGITQPPAKSPPPPPAKAVGGPT